MATLSLLDRQRERTRDRPRPSVPGNFITAIFYSSLYTLNFPPFLQSYIKWWPYAFPESKALGYFDNPVIQPVWVPLGPVSKPQAVYKIVNALIPGVSTGFEIPTTIVSNPVTVIPADFPGLGDQVQTEIIVAPSVLPVSVGAGVQLTADVSLNPGDAFSFVPGTVPRQPNPTTFPIRDIIIVADSANLNPIWLGYKPTLAVNNGFKLAAGSGVGLKINDLSKVYLVASNDTDKAHIIYDV